MINTKIKIICWVCIAAFVLMISAVRVCASGKVEKESDMSAAPYGLKLNLLDQPLGVTIDSLSFSWENNLENNMGKQSAYRIVIAPRMAQLESGEYIFDSGWKEGTENTSVQMDLSDILKDNELYYWQVKIKNAEGKESLFSKPQAFTTETIWKNTQGMWCKEDSKTAFFRRKFTVPEDIERVILSITALDGSRSRQYVYQLYVNGTEIGLGPVRPNGMQLDYDTYDITECLKTDMNVIGAVLYSEDNASFMCQMTAYLSDGSSMLLMNSGNDTEKWKVLSADDIFIGKTADSIGASGYTAIPDNIDASIYPYGWNQPEGEFEEWDKPVLNHRFDGYILRTSQNVHYKHYEVSPKSVEKKKDGSYLIDFGKEIVGTVRMDLQGKKNNIILQYGEQLDRDGNAQYKMLTGNFYQETWKLKNGYQTLSGIGMKTFRYLTIKNMASELTADQVTGLAVRASFKDEDSDFQSSNSILNDLYSMTKYTSKMTNQGLYVDTQSRERMAYEGDTLIAGMTSFSFSPASAAFKYSSEYLLDNTTWPSEYSLYNIMSVYQHYMYTGDKRTLEEDYQKLRTKTMEQFFDPQQGLMKNAVTSFQRIMVDWPATENDNYRTADSYYNTVFNAVCAGSYKDMAAIAAVLGYESDRVHYQKMSDEIKSNMIRKLYNPETGEFYDGLKEDGTVVQHSAQHATAYALAFGIYNSQAMSDQMAQAIENDGELKMSVYGSYFLLKGLYESNHGLLARKIMTNPDDEMGVRSWAYMMYGLGATITSEAWNSDLKHNMSLSHAWGSGPGSMLARGMFGIQPTSPGFSTIEVKLQPGGVKSAAVRVPTMKGQVEVSYEIPGDGRIRCNIRVPANARAALYLPIQNQTDDIYINQVHQKGINDKEGYIGCILEGGVYTVETQGEVYEDLSEMAETDIVSDACVMNRWNGEKTNDLIQGDIEGENFEGFKLRIKNPMVTGGVEYSAYMQTYGWQQEVSDGAISGLPGSGKRLEALKINLTGELSNICDVYYRVFVKDWGWLDWAQNGEPAGSSGYAKGITALETRLVRKGSRAPGDREEPYRTTEWTIAYSTHVQSYGWQTEVGDGEVSGTTGERKRLEALKIHVLDPDVRGDISYCTHVQSYGWLGWVKNGEISGTSGEAKRLEAVQIKLTGELNDKYDIYYRVHAQSYGWLGWAKNGEKAGTEGMAKRLEAIQIRLIPKGHAAPGDTEGHFIVPQVSYQTHIQTYGWQHMVYDEQISGTEGEGKRLEAIKIKLCNSETEGGIQYCTHVQTYGWLDWAENGSLSGTEGEGKRLEAIRIRLTGDMEQRYDIYYRVHVQSYGWLGWAKNGESAGTEGMGKRLESIQIIVEEKGKGAPGPTDGHFKKPQVYYQTHVQSYGWQQRVYDGETSGTEGKAKRLEAVRIGLYESEMSGEIQYSTHVQSYGWQEWVSDGLSSGTEGEGKRLEAIRIRLTGELADKYDVCYRVHAQTYGWMDWVKNGEVAGTEGQGKRLEAIQIILKQKTDSVRS